MNKTYIIGTGYLSDNLNKRISNSKIYSAQEFVNNIHIINNNKKINLIINSFYSAKKLNNLYSYKVFTQKSIYFVWIEIYVN